MDLAAGIAAKPYDNTDAKKKLNERARLRNLPIPFPEVEADDDPVNAQVADTIAAEAVNDLVAMLDITPALANGLISRALERLHRNRLN